MQVAEIERVAPQFVLEIANSAAFAPVTVMLLMVRDAPEPFANVTDWDGLLDPTDVAGKDRLVGDAVAVVEGTTATPESATD